MKLWYACDLIRAYPLERQEKLTETFWRKVYESQITVKVWKHDIIQHILNTHVQKRGKRNRWTFNLINRLQTNNAMTKLKLTIQVSDLTEVKDGKTYIANKNHSKCKRTNT